MRYISVPNRHGGQPGLNSLYSSLELFRVCYHYLLLLLSFTNLLITI